jgi:hypothetical protein
MGPLGTIIGGAHIYNIDRALVYHAFSFDWPRRERGLLQHSRFFIGLDCGRTEFFRYAPLFFDCAIVGTKFPGQDLRLQLPAVGHVAQ